MSSKSEILYRHHRIRDGKTYVANAVEQPIASLTRAVLISHGPMPERSMRNSPLARNAMVKRGPAGDVWRYFSLTVSL